MPVILSIDPGRDKCGVAVMSDSSVLFKNVVATTALKDEVSELLRTFSPEVAIMGTGTWSKKLKSVLSPLLLIPLVMVDEKHTTEEAKVRYFKDNPPKGFMRLIPLGVQIPPVPYDDYAAILLAERYLKNLREGQM